MATLSSKLPPGNIVVLTDITYEQLDTNGDVGTGAGQVSIGDHDHDAVYEPIDATILKDADIGGTVQAHSAVLDATTASFLTEDETKIDSLESGATADQTGAEIKTAYEAEANAFTDAQFTKLAGIETSATADQTGAEIKTAYEANADTNVFLDAEKTKLTGIETSATADQTAGEIEAIVDHDNLVGFVADEHIDWTTDQGATNIDPANIEVSGGISFVRKTANYTALVSEGVIADTSGGTFTVTLPITPAIGDQVIIADGDDWSAINLTIGRNGETIEGDASDLNMDIGGVSVSFIYDGTTWEIYAQAGVAISDMPPETIKMRDEGTTGNPKDVKISDLTEDTTPGANNWVLGESGSGSLVKFQAVSGVISSGSNANGFFRTWSDGYIEQWGFNNLSAGTSRTFPISFTTLASIVMSGTWSDSNSSDVRGVVADVTSITQYILEESSGGSSTKPAQWTAQGF